MSNLRDELRDVFRDAAVGSAEGAHLELEELAAYHCGQRPAAQERRIQDHLALCQTCTDTLLELAAFPDLECDELQEISQGELFARWALISKRLDLPPEAAGGGGGKEGRRLWNVPILFTAYAPYALAASLLVAAVGLFLWVAQLRRENRRLSAQVSESERRAALADEQLAAGRRDVNDAGKSLADARQELERQSEERARAREESAREVKKRAAEIAGPRRPARAESQSARGGATEVAANTPAAELYPSEVLRGEPDGAKAVELARGARLLSLTLNTKHPGRYASYALEILDEAGTNVWGRAGLRKGAQGNLTVAVPLRLLPEGQYRLRLYGSQSGARTGPLDEYLVRVRYR